MGGGSPVGNLSNVACRSTENEQISPSSRHSKFKRLYGHFCALYDFALLRVIMADWLGARPALGSLLPSFSHLIRLGLLSADNYFPQISIT